MSAAAVEHPCDGEPPTLLEEADLLMEQLPGYRVEIIGGILTVTPPPDAPHARALTKIMRPFIAANLDDGETEVLQGVGVWLPTGAEDFVIPDLAVVDADIDAHVIAHNCYDPVIFRLVLEVTSTNYNQDLRAKVSVYAEADIPVYVIVNRKHQRVHVLTEPVGSDYASHQIFAAGQHAPLPASIGGDVTLDVAAILRAGTTVRAKD
ncbi:Uma2 family endonuclease [Streptomyces sp. NPDC059398]|uniref:Uma2 family endonuclease n=1 Tax=Streptomyces sp. NPDC059398 TaxID=3346820 RepID=UPI0036A3943D